MSWPPARAYGEPRHVNYPQPYLSNNLEISSKHQGSCTSAARIAAFVTKDRRYWPYRQRIGCRTRLFKELSNSCELQPQLVQQAYGLLSDDFRRSQYDEQVKLFGLRKKLDPENTDIQWKKLMDAELGTGGPTSYERSIPGISTLTAVAPKSYQNVLDEYERETWKGLSSCELASDGDQNLQFTRDEEHLMGTVRKYTTETLPRSLVFKEEMKKTRDTAKTFAGIVGFRKEKPGKDM